jgi:putative flippase GtrA
VHKVHDLLCQAFNYAAVGVLNTLAGLGTIFALMALLGIPALVANLLGYAVGLFLSYALNRRWTFRAAHAGWGARARFFLLMGSAYLVQFGLLALLLSLSVNPYVAQAIATAVYALIGFVGSRFLVFTVVAGQKRRHAE